MPVAVDKLSNQSVCTSDIDYFVDMPGQSRRLEDRDRRRSQNSDIHMIDSRPDSTHHLTCSRAKKNYNHFNTTSQTQCNHVSSLDIKHKSFSFHFDAKKN